MKWPPMFFRYALMLAMGALAGCGSSASPVKRPVRTASLEKIGALGFAARQPTAEPRAMELWVRLGAYDATPPQAATVLAWSFENEELAVSVFPFATRFSWSCSPTEPFVSCAERGLRVLVSVPDDYDFARTRERLVAARRASSSVNPDAMAALDQFLSALFQHPSRLRPFGSPSDDDALTEAAVARLWERYYGANNALLVSYGFTPSDRLALSARARELREADDTFAHPATSFTSGQVRSGETSPGYGWIAAMSSCFEVLAELRATVGRLAPAQISHLIDVRGQGYVAVFVGPAVGQEATDLLHTLVPRATCQSADPVMRWLIGELGLDTTR